MPSPTIETPWMAPLERARYDAVCIISECMYQCMLEINRPGWLEASRILVRSAENWFGPQPIPDAIYIKLGRNDGPKYGGLDETSQSSD